MLEIIIRFTLRIRRRLEIRPLQFSHIRRPVRHAEVPIAAPFYAGDLRRLPSPILKTHVTSTRKAIVSNISAQRRTNGPGNLTAVYTYKRKMNYRLTVEHCAQIAASRAWNWDFENPTTPYRFCLINRSPSLVQPKLPFARFFRFLLLLVNIEAFSL